MQWTGGSTELVADGAQIKTVCCIKCASRDDLIVYGGCLHVLCAECSCANLLCPVGGCGGKDPLSLHQLATLPGWRHLTLDSSAFAEGMARELSTIGNRLLQNAQVSRANGPVSNAHVVESESCLLVLNLVSSTLPCVRQSRPRLTLTCAGGVPQMHSRSRGAQISVMGKKVLSLEKLDREKDAKIKAQDAKIKQLELELAEYKNPQKRRLALNNLGTIKWAKAT